MALIDQDATIRALVQLHEETGVKTAQAIRVVREMQEAGVVKRRSGKWIKAKPMSGKVGIVCSACGNEAYWDSDYGQQLFDWCPYCGADMIKETEDE